MIIIEKPYNIGYNYREISSLFVETKHFTKRWQELNFDDDDLRLLEGLLVYNPQVGKIIRGTGGLRKLRFAFKNSGKSSSARICYICFEEYSITYLIDAYSKKEKDNLSDKEKSNIKSYIKCIKKELEKKHEIL